MTIRVRFAPSPTGYLHIGGVRTALFNFLYARSQQGQFCLRIEDTDQERSRPEYEDEILKSMEWLGLQWDGAILRQSERLALYKKFAQELVQKGTAYEETADGKMAVKFRMPKLKAVFHDLVHGPVEFDTALFDDLVMIKSDGYPTYHWACVVDDHEMEISHVIRGDDHVSNTPRQILMFEAMGWKPPKYAHLPLIMGNDGTPLSKRHGAVSLTHFKNEGFIPEGLLNYLALLGWGISANEEFFRLEELVKKFSIKRVNKSNARFDMEKLQWLNAQHLKKIPEEDYLKRLTDYYPGESGLLRPEDWKKLCLLFRTRIRTLKDLKPQAAYCFEEPVVSREDAAKYFSETPALGQHLKAWLEAAEKLASFSDIKELESETRKTAEACGIQAGVLIHPLRLALTGMTASPGLFELMSVLGKEVCLKRVRSFLTIIA